MRRLVIALSIGASLITQSPRSAVAETAIEVIAPDADNLQFMSFWVAYGAGYFRDEGLAITPRTPSTPRAAKEALRAGAKVALLPAPMALELIEENAPIVLVANLLKNDPINLVIRRTLIEEKKLDAKAPLCDRLRALKGLKVGVAPNPPTRLRVLFRSCGLDADTFVRMTIVAGPRQNVAFGEEDVDALYAHTPYLERALLHQDAVMWVHQSGGEVPELANRMIHALAVRHDFATQNDADVQRMVRAIRRAQTLLRTHQEQAVEALSSVFKDKSKVSLSLIVSLYQAAIPDDTQIDEQAIKQALVFYPATRTPPVIAQRNLRAFLDVHVQRKPTAVITKTRSRLAFLLVGGLGALFVLLIAFYESHDRTGRG